MCAYEASIFDKVKSLKELTKKEQKSIKMKCKASIHLHTRRSSKKHGATRITRIKENPRICNSNKH